MLLSSQETIYIYNKNITYNWPIYFLFKETTIVDNIQICKITTLLTDYIAHVNYITDSLHITLTLLLQYFASYSYIPLLNFMLVAKTILFNPKHSNYEK